MYGQGFKNCKDEEEQFGKEGKQGETDGKVKDESLVLMKLGCSPPG